MRDQARLQAHDERVAERALPGLRDERRRRDACEERDERQQQERRGERRGEPEQGREEPPHRAERGAGPKPAARSNACARGAASIATKARAARGFGAFSTTAAP